VRDLTPLPACLWLSASLLLACGASDEGPAAGSGSIQGKVAGKTFQSVGASYVIGESDDPDHTVVVYVFDRPIECSQIGSPGWDTTIADASQALEMKLIGTKPATYPVAAGPNAGQGEASVNYTLSSTAHTPSEISSTAGSVKLDSVKSEGPAAGSFDLTFPDGTLGGSFSAVWCSNGHEP